MATILDSFKSDQPIHKEAQRLRWFLDSFNHQNDITSQETGNNYQIDTQKLTDTFTFWLKEFIKQKPDDPKEKPEYVGFAAGLMLKALIQINPVKQVSIPDSSDEFNPAYFWPEGYLYVTYCLKVRGLVIQSDYEGSQNLSQSFKEPRIWWSFKENVLEDSSLAIAFLDVFAGDQPDWKFPNLFKSGDIEKLGTMK